ncbi:MAG TPA: hypothetical protein VEU47_10960 [Candidatus Cybelea sp.]|nr:hypothetical protein [Candidatus Cybelea sp.]
MPRSRAEFVVEMENIKPLDGEPSHAIGAQEKTQPPRDIHQGRPQRKSSGTLPLFAQMSRRSGASHTTVNRTLVISIKKAAIFAASSSDNFCFARFRSLMTDMAPALRSMPLIIAETRPVVKPQ